MIENLKIRTVFYPLREDEEDSEKITKWLELTVVLIEKLSVVEYIENGDPAIVEDIFFICFDKKSDNKVLYKLSISEVKIGKYEINELRGSHTAYRKKTGKSREYNHPGNSIGEKEIQGG